VQKKLPISIIAICLAFFSCQDSPKIIRVDFIDRNEFSMLDKQSNSLLLVVEIDENERLSLNKIETGTMSDLKVLNGILKVVFEEREKAGINEREVIIDPRGNVKNEDLKKLIESLAEVKAAPIRVIKNNP
jgi:hypothetical protein